MAESVCEFGDSDDDLCMGVSGLFEDIIGGVEGVCTSGDGTQGDNGEKCNREVDGVGGHYEDNIMLSNAQKGEGTRGASYMASELQKGERFC